MALAVGHTGTVALPPGAPPGSCLTRHIPGPGGACEDVAGDADAWKG